MRPCLPQYIFGNKPRIFIFGYLKKNDDSVKEAPAYCRSFLDGLRNWKGFHFFHYFNSDLQAGIQFGSVALCPINTLPHFTMVQSSLPKNVVFLHTRTCVMLRTFLPSREILFPVQILERISSLGSVVLWLSR